MAVRVTVWICVCVGLAPLSVVLVWLLLPYQVVANTTVAVVSIVAALYLLIDVCLTRRAELKRAAVYIGLLTLLGLLNGVCAIAGR
jgi:hypothetical protein